MKKILFSIVLSLSCVSLLSAGDLSPVQKESAVQKSAVQKDAVQKGDTVRSRRRLFGRRPIRTVLGLPLRAVSCASGTCR